MNPAPFLRTAPILLAALLLCAGPATAADEPPARGNSNGGSAARSTSTEGGSTLAALLAKLQKKPDDYALNLKAGKLYAASGQVANALACYEKARRANANSLETHYLLATLHIQNGRYENAVKISKEWLGRDSKSYYGHFCLADAMSLNGQVKESLDVLRELQKIYPSDTAIIEAMKLRFQYLQDAKSVEKADQMIAEINS